MKPYFVKRLTEWNTCVCRHHSEMEELCVGINAMRAKGQEIYKNYTCTCQICRPLRIPIDILGCQPLHALTIDFRACGVQSSVRSQDTLSSTDESA
jgi:hypothetical protein